MKTTRYFEEQVLRKRKRPYIRREWCGHVLTNPIRKEVQPDGRVRFWGSLQAIAAEEFSGRILRVIPLADGETIHNAFFDRGFQRENR